jgi:hypothetical protein
MEENGRRRYLKSGKEVGALAQNRIPRCFMEALCS